MPLTKAQCTNCGGALDVDSSMDAAVCPFCNTPYVVEKAINLFQNHYNITVNGISPDTIIKNAYILLQDGDKPAAAKLLSDYKKYNADDWRLWFALSEVEYRSYTDHIKKALKYYPDNADLQKVLDIQDRICGLKSEQKDLQNQVADTYQVWLAHDPLHKTGEEAEAKRKIRKSGINALVFGVIMILVFKFLPTVAIYLLPFLAIITLFNLLKVIINYSKIKKHKLSIIKRDTKQKVLKDQINDIQNDINNYNKECISIGKKLIKEVITNF